jgi:mannose-6-phosphate isomerase-like protein (cupin superfamily)
MADVRAGDGWAAATLDDLGEGPGFRKVRTALGVEEFGVNAIVMPAAYASAPHYHERQEELYLVLEGEIEFTVGGETVTLGPGGLVRVAAHTVRSLRNTSPDDEATYFCVGAHGGYVGRDGRRPERSGDERAKPRGRSIDGPMGPG